MPLYALIIGFLMIVWVHGIMAGDQVKPTFRWAKSSWNSTSGAVIRYDKLEHFAGTALLTAGLYGMGKLFQGNHPVSDSFLSSLILGVSWEYKDAVYPCETYGKMGGEGFCLKDLAADIAGAALTVGIVYLIKKI